MKIIVLLPANFKNYELFKNELLNILDLYSYNTDFRNFEYIYINKTNSLVDKFCNEFDIKYRNLFTLNYKKYKNNTFFKTLKEMFDYIKEDENSLIVDFHDIYNISKNKFSLYKKYANYIYIHIISYNVYTDPLACCNQDLYLWDSDDTFDFYICECCGNRYILLQILIDEYIINSTKVEILRKKNYLKGDFK